MYEVTGIIGKTNFASFMIIIHSIHLFMCNGTQRKIRTHSGQ